MVRVNMNRGSDSGTTQNVISKAVGAAEALTVGVVHLAERTIVETLHAAQDVGGEIGATLLRAARGSIQAAGEIGGDLVHAGRTVSRGITEPARDIAASFRRTTDGGQRSSAPRQNTDGASDGRARKPLAKARGQRRRRRSAA
jgi:hypothetical protein